MLLCCFIFFFLSEQFSCQLLLMSIKKKIYYANKKKTPCKYYFLSPIKIELFYRLNELQSSLVQLTVLESRESHWERIWPILWKTELRGHGDLICSKNVNTSDRVFLF